MKNLAIELFGGPHDGFSIDCLLTPPPYFLLPVKAKNVATVYYFESVFYSEGKGRLRYVFSGYQAISKDELQVLRGMEASARYR